MLKADQVSDVDKLDRKRFSKEISRNLLLYFENNNESLVIGVHGAWGSGKSTLLQFIKDELKSDPYFKGLPKKGSSNSIHLIEFNPWIFSGKEELHSTFLNELAISVGGKKQKLRKAIKAISNRFEGLSNIHQIGIAANKALAGLADVSIQDLKNEINQILLEKGIKIIVVMDDIDRLSPSEILEVFQLIKLNANFKNTVFLISFDKSIVCESISNQYKIDGEKYLEKIVQVDYSLPTILAEDIESIFFEELQNLLSTHKIKFETKAINTPWLIDGLKDFFRNIRDITRYFNSLNFRLPSFHKNVDIHDFLIIEAIRLFDFESYELIRLYYKDSKQFGKESGSSKKLGKIGKSKSEKLFKYLFESNSKYYQESPKYRISDSEFFDRYFSLSVSRKDLKEEDFLNFLEYPETRLNILKEAIINKKIDFFLRRLSVQISIPDQSKIISLLISVWDDHPSEFSHYWRSVWDTLGALIKSDEEMAGRNFLIKELSVSHTKFSPARFAFLWLLLQHVEKSDDRIEAKGISLEFLKDKYEKLLADFKHLLDNYQNLFFENTIQVELYQGIFFPSFAKYHKETYINRFKYLINDEKIFLILNLLVLRDSTSKEPFGIDNDYFAVLLPENLKIDLENNLKVINRKSLSKADAKTVEYYLKYLENIAD